MSFSLAVALSLLAVGALIALPRDAVTQNSFPEGAGRDVLFLACTQCHSLGKMLTAKLTAEEWQMTVYDMISRGAPVYKSDMPELTRYLQENFATDSSGK